MLFSTALLHPFVKVENRMEDRSQRAKRLSAEYSLGTIFTRPSDKSCLMQRKILVHCSWVRAGAAQIALKEFRSPLYTCSRQLNLKKAIIGVKCLSWSLFITLRTLFLQPSEPWRQPALQRWPTAPLTRAAGTFLGCTLCHSRTPRVECSHTLHLYAEGIKKGK